MKQMELNTEMEKHKKTKSELDGRLMLVMAMIRSKKGSEYSCGGENEIMRENRLFDRKLFPEGSFQRVWNWQGE